MKKLANKDLEELVYRALTQCPCDDDRETAKYLVRVFHIVEDLSLKV